MFSPEQMVKRIVKLILKPFAAANSIMIHKIAQRMCHGLNLMYCRMSTSKT